MNEGPPFIPKEFKPKQVELNKDDALEVAFCEEEETGYFEDQEAVQALLQDALDNEIKTGEVSSIVLTKPAKRNEVNSAQEAKDFFYKWTQDQHKKLEKADSNNYAIKFHKYTDSLEGYLDEYIPWLEKHATQEQCAEVAAELYEFAGIAAVIGLSLKIDSGEKSDKNYARITELNTRITEMFIEPDGDSDINEVFDRVAKRLPQSWMVQKNIETLKAGLHTEVAAARLFRELGYSCVVSTPEEDREHGFDLVIPELENLAVDVKKSGHTELFTTWQEGDEMKFSGSGRSSAVSLEFGGIKRILVEYAQEYGREGVPKALSLRLNLEEALDPLEREEVLAKLSDVLTLVKEKIDDNPR